MIQQPNNPVLIDPPEGWKYGFPKKAESEPEDLKQWCIDNGYPKDQADLFGNYFNVRIIPLNL